MESRVVDGEEGDLSDDEDGLGKLFRRQEKGQLVEYEDENQQLPFKPHWDSEGEDELSETEADILFQATKLAMERDEEAEGFNQGSSEDSDISTESEQEGGDSDYSYTPSKNPAGRIHAGMSKPSKKVNAKVATKRVATDDGGQKRKAKKQLSYEFCPLIHRVSILRLLSKHFCLHPLLPEQHGQPRSSEQIYRDSVYEMYLHCKNNQLHEVWAYLWSSWYSSDKWKLWARSAYPYAIPRKRTTMVVEAMWRNFKRLVLHLHNHPRVDFATYALVTQALPSYRNKLVRILDDPRKGRATNLTGEQIPIKKAWLLLLNKEIKGKYDTNVVHWTCSCSAQKYHSYLLCKHLVQALPHPDPDWWTTVV